MTPRAFAALAGAWDADSGPPRATLLPRTERSAASFEARILAHALEPIVARAPTPPSSWPWVLGIAAGPRASAGDSTLRRVLAPRHGISLVHAGDATVPMALFEAIGHLQQHEAVLVTFAQDATPPYHEALAAALLLTREPTSPNPLVLQPPTLRRTTSPSRRTAIDRHPFTPALALARAILVGQATVRTTPTCEPDRSQYWQIELCSAF